MARTMVLAPVLLTIFPLTTLLESPRSLSVFPLVLESIREFRFVVPST